MLRINTAEHSNTANVLTLDTTGCKQESNFFPYVGRNCREIAIPPKLRLSTIIFFQLVLLIKKNLKRVTRTLLLNRYPFTKL